MMLGVVKLSRGSLQPTSDTTVLKAPTAVANFTSPSSCLMPAALRVGAAHGCPRGPASELLCAALVEAFWPSAVLSSHLFRHPNSFRELRLVEKTALIPLSPAMCKVSLPIH